MNETLSKNLDAMVALTTEYEFQRHLAELLVDATNNVLNEE